MTRIIIFSGAGISAASGIPTFRDDLWRINDINEVCHRDTYKTNKSKDFFNMLRSIVDNSNPNSNHYWIYKLSEKYDVMNYTQNIDNLLERVGCKNVVHVHGSMYEQICENCGIITHWTGDNCECGGYMRINVVMYGEKGYYVQLIQDIFNLTDKDICIVAGTSGKVFPIGSILSASDCIKILVNIESNDDDKYYDYNVYGKMEDNLNEIDKIIKTIYNNK